MSSITYTVAGMHCSHCVAAVTDEIGKVPGVEDVDVDLVADGDSRVTVTGSTDPDEAAIRAAVDEAGYELTGVAR
jgi:copper chaperone